MKDTVLRIRNNTFRVYVEDSKGAVGTAFATSNSSLIAANHVVNPTETKKPTCKVHLTGPNGEMYEGTIEDSNNEADLARIITDSKIVVNNPFDVVSPPPEIGQLCIWGGFPKLVGESSPRLRFARGMVSSEMYRSQDGIFFELDGMFSPGHSGSAVINLETGDMVGVVSRSAGDLFEQFSKARDILNAIQVIQSSWKIFEKTMQSMEEVIDSFGEVIPEIERRFEDVSGAFEFGRFPFWSSIKMPHLWLRSDWENHIGGKLPSKVIEILQDKGIRISKHESGVYMTAKSDVAWSALIQLLLEWTKLMEDAIDESFQMGIGVATCGEPLMKLL